MIPILTNIGLALPGVFVGSFLIEVFFSIPGLGREVLLAVNRSDYPGDPGRHGVPRGADDGDQPGHRRAVQAGRSAGGPQMSAVLVDQRPAARRASASSAEGVWHAAWRRFRADRVGLVSLAIVLAFLLLIVLSARSAWSRGDWQREVGVPNAPPTLLGPRRPRRPARSRCRRGRTSTCPTSTRSRRATRSGTSAPRKFKTEEAARPRRCRSAATGSAATCWPRRSRARRSRSSSACWRRWSPPLIGTLLGAFAGFFGGKVGDFLEWLYNVFSAIPGILLIFAFAAVFGRGIGTVVLILGADRLDRHVPAGARRVPEARAARVRARRRGDRRLAAGRACSATSCPT